MSVTSADNTEVDVFRLLRQADAQSFGSICTDLSITVPADKKGNKGMLNNLIMRDLASADMESREDGGMSVF